MATAGKDAMPPRLVISRVFTGPSFSRPASIETFCSQRSMEIGFGCSSKVANAAASTANPKFRVTADFIVAIPTTRPSRSRTGPPLLPGLIAGAFASDPVIAVILIAVVLFGFQVAIGNIQTMPSQPVLSSPGKSMAISCVDGVSGATITSRGVDEMVAVAVQQYDAYLKNPKGAF